MLNEPLSEADARKLIRRIIEDGDTEFWHHAREDMSKDRLSEADCLNVLRGGWPEAGEYHNGHWRHQVHTRDMCVVVQFESENELAIVTAWRKLGQT